MAGSGSNSGPGGGWSSTPASPSTLGPGPGSSPPPCRRVRLLSEFPRLLSRPQMDPSEGPQVGISWPSSLAGHGAQGPLARDVVGVCRTVVSVPARLVLTAPASPPAAAPSRPSGSRPLAGRAPPQASSLVAAVARV